jgi:acetyl esterase
MWDVLLRDHGFNSAKKIDVDNLPAYASPIHRENLAGLPPAYIEASEFDPLRDEAVNYAQALGAAGVDVSLKLVKGGVHAYDFIDCDITKKYKKARVNALIKFFEKETMPD